MFKNTRKEFLRLMACEISKIKHRTKTDSVAHENGFCDYWDRNPIHDNRIKLYCVKSYYVADITVPFLDQAFPSATTERSPTYRWRTKLRSKNILFRVVQPTWSFFPLCTAAGLKRQANYNQPLGSAAQSQLYPICLFNFFLAWLTLVLSFPKCSWWQHDMPYLCNVLCASENTHLHKGKVKWPKYYNVSTFNFALYFCTKILYRHITVLPFTCEFQL